MEMKISYQQTHDRLVKVNISYRIRENTLIFSFSLQDLSHRDLPVQQLSAVSSHDNFVQNKRHVIKFQKLYQKPVDLNQVRLHRFYIASSLIIYFMDFNDLNLKIILLFLFQLLVLLLPYQNAKLRYVLYEVLTIFHQLAFVKNPVLNHSVINYVILFLIILVKLQM